MNNKFTHSFLGIFAIATLGTAVLPNQVQASTIVLNSGQVLGNPGTPSQTDSNITYWTLGVPVNPLSPITFTAADFLKAQGIGCSGPDICGSAKVVADFPFASPPWIPSLPHAPNARWINWEVGPSPSFYGSPAASVLYAYRFNVPESTINSAAIEMYWAVDDFLGEYTPANANGGPGPYFPDPNQIGVYINGHALGSSFSGAGRFPEYSASQSGIEGLLKPGQNWLYVYQRDAGGAYSGTIFCASISVNVPSSGGKPCAAPVPEPSSIIGLAVLSTLGAASTLKRQIKSSKPSEKETTKVG
ncbi:PEP-CTERM sorting domain-containing protein [Microcystis aeruginosa]|uniref:PEP-CTERM sorting domain-containing protein n=1 Tax=Microcystis aeruginosa TaxID=1126 RepID=UPI00232F64B1|nr:PEP-CTERM sorting domain-containing protein [Microcystis aeruginosa]MDB9389790.1 PEP-CTERM sorting domain-containing protein [Microcystis aeruginosa CS-579]